METRRKFIKKTAAFSVAGVLSNWALNAFGEDRLGEVLPQRQLTRNGEKVTAFTLGGYHSAKSFNPAQAEKLIERAIELGVRFFDNARVYHQGVLDFYLDAKAKGKTRYIGFSCHTNPKVALYFLDFLDKRGIELDTCQFPVNVCDASFESFQKQLLPVLLEKKYGVIAMKTMAGGGIIGRRFDLTPDEFKDEDIKNITKESAVTIDQLHQYVYSYPVSTLVSGCETVEELEHNTATLKNLKKLSDDEMKKIAKLAQPFVGRYAEHYKRIL